MRPRLFTWLVSSVAVGISAAAAAPPTTAEPAPSPKSLTLASTGPTLVVGNGALLESIDPGTGRVVASIKPVDVADLTWKRLDRRGGFLLAEGWSELRKGPIPYFERGIVLFNDAGAVLWSRTQAFPLNGFASTLFLGDDGSVGLDGHDGPGIILVDGTKVETPTVPVGAVVGGVAPLARRGEDGVGSWFYVAKRQEQKASELLASDRKAIEQKLVISPAVDRDKQRASLVIELAVNLGAEDERYRRPVKTVARLRLPEKCQGTTDLQPTLAPDIYVLRCNPWQDDRDRRPQFFTVNLKKRKLAPIQPPRTDDQHIFVGASVDADGTVLASVSSGCSTELFAASPGKKWREIPFKQEWGASMGPTPIAGSLAMQGVAWPVYNHNCGWAPGTKKPDVLPGTWTYFRRPDGPWLALPYRVAAPLSADRNWAVSFDGTAMVRLDREQRVVLPNALGREPYAWLP
jgi:hypothetical protein